MSVEGLEMLRKHMSYYDFNPDSVLLLGNVLYYAKKAEVEVAELEAENAKLRELVKAMEPFLCCMPFASCNTLAANVRNRMRELGVSDHDGRP